MVTTTRKCDITSRRAALIIVLLQARGQLVLLPLSSGKLFTLWM